MQKAIDRMTLRFMARFALVPTSRASSHPSATNTSQSLLALTLDEYFDPTVNFRLVEQKKWPPPGLCG
jgi:hypothetical protein